MNFSIAAYRSRSQKNQRSAFIEALLWKESILRKWSQSHGHDDVFVIVILVSHGLELRL